MQRGERDACLHPGRRSPVPGGVRGDPDEVHAASVVLVDDEDVEARRRKTVSRWAKSTARIAWACADRNWCQVGPDRRGAGSRPALFKIFQMVEAGYRVAESDQLALDGL